MPNVRHVVACCGHPSFEFVRIWEVTRRGIQFSREREGKLMPEPASDARVPEHWSDR